MSLLDLAQAFFTAVEKTEQFPVTVLNYVWINQKAAKPDKDGVLCHVPLHYLDNAFVNAKENPRTDVIIWLDHKLLDPTSLFFVQSHAYYNAPSNISFRDLNEIPRYKKWGAFNPNQNIWKRVDLARLLVMDHSFIQTDAEQVFYSDFDITNIKIAAGFLQKRLRHFGFIVGKTNSGVVENSFFGFTREKGLATLRHNLLPMTRQSVRTAENGYPAFRVWVKLSSITKNRKICAVKVPCSGYVMPKPKLYKDYKIG